MTAEVDFRAMGDALVDAVQSRFKDFLAEHKEVAEFVINLGRRYAVLSARYHLAQDETIMEETLKDLRRVENTMELELDAISHEVRPELLGQLKAALGVVLNFAIQNLPTVLAMIRR